MTDKLSYTFLRKWGKLDLFSIRIKLVSIVRHCFEQFLKPRHPRKKSKYLRAVEEKIPVASDKPLELELQHFIKSIKKNEVLKRLCSTREALQVLKVVKSAFAKLRWKS